jgi:PAS domain S-box-containing protein
MVWVKDAEDLRFVLFNKAGEDLLGVSRDQLLGKSDYDFFPSEQAEALVVRDREALSSGGTVETHEEEILSGTKGVRILRSKRTVILGAGRPRYILGLSHDITDLVENDRQDLLRQLEDAQRIEAMSVVVGKFVHDLNNMLAVIMMAAQSLVASIESGAAAREEIEEIVTAANRAAELARQLRALSRR